jgi:hypothetical protein
MNDTASRTRPLRTAATIVVACGVLLAAGIALYWPRTTAVKTFTQPAGVVYADGSVHTAVLRHVRAPISALQPWTDGSSDHDHYEVCLGRDPGGGYGHFVRLGATDLDPARLTVEWSADGAWLTFTSGHRVLVPAASFIGGR